MDGPRLRPLLQTEHSIHFSRKTVVRLENSPAVLVRLRNKTPNELLDLKATMMAWFIDPDRGGDRRFFALELEREGVSFLPLSWILVHPITPANPLHNQTKLEFDTAYGELFIQVQGVDQISGRIVFASTSYMAEDVEWGAQFAYHYTHDPRTDYRESMHDISKPLRMNLLLRGTKDTESKTLWCPFGPSHS